MKLQSLRDLYLDQLRDLFSAEQQIVEALPKIVKSASFRELQKAFQNHYEETGEHVSRLSKIFEELGEPTGGKTCQGMKGLLREGSEYLESKNEIAAPVLDAGLIAAAQRVEHYEISAYGTARTFADLLGEHEAAQLLAQTLEEEEQADKTLTKVAGKLNLEAEGASGKSSSEKSSVSAAGKFRSGGPKTRR